MMLKQVIPTGRGYGAFERVCFVVACAASPACGSDAPATVKAGSAALSAEVASPTGADTAVAGALEPGPQACGYLPSAELSARCMQCIAVACCVPLEACRADSTCARTVADYFLCAAEETDLFGTCFEGLALSPGAAAGAREVGQCLRAACLGC